MILFLDAGIEVQILDLLLRARATALPTDEFDPRCAVVRRAVKQVVQTTISEKAPKSMFHVLRGWLRRKRALPLTPPEFTIAISPPAPGAAVDLRPYTEKEIKAFCKVACPAGFEILQYPKPGDEPRVTLHLKGEPPSHKHTMFIVRGRSARRRA